MAGQEGHPGLVDQGQQPVVTQVAAVIQVGGAHGHLRGKGVAIERFQLDAGHDELLKEYPAAAS
jgi:hypothetical protein